MLTLTSAQTEPIRLFGMRRENPAGERSVLLTNLHDDTSFSAQAVIDLYLYRWTVEVHSRDEKTSLDIETFHLMMITNGGKLCTKSVKIFALLT
ncbi:MAG: hypothetical protein KC592_16150 [Nitrospira sp.]|nr:hypothetical protein [Nitrospira sp.]